MNTGAGCNALRSFASAQMGGSRLRQTIKPRRREGLQRASAIEKTEWLGHLYATLDSCHLNQRKWTAHVRKRACPPVLSRTYIKDLQSHAGSCVCMPAPAVRLHCVCDPRRGAWTRSARDSAGLFARSNRTRDRCGIETIKDRPDRFAPASQYSDGAGL